MDFKGGSVNKAADAATPINETPSQVVSTEATQDPELDMAYVD